MTPEEIQAAIGLFVNAQQREQACLNLAANGGADAIPALVERVSQVPPGNEFQRQAYAAFALGLMGTGAAAAIPALIQQLDGNAIHNGTRQHIVRALAKIAPGNAAVADVREAIQRQVTHPDRNVRLRSFEAIEALFDEGEG